MGVNKEIKDKYRRMVWGDWSDFKMMLKFVVCLAMWWWFFSNLVEWVKPIWD